MTEEEAKTKWWPLRVITTKIQLDKLTILLALISFWITVYLEISRSALFIPALLMTIGITGIAIHFATRHHFHDIDQESESDDGYNGENSERVD